MIGAFAASALAQETLTVYDGTNSTLTTNSQIPMYGNYFDDYTKSEFVIPAAQLTEMENAEISALKFYISSVGSYGSGWSGTHQVVFLKEVEYASLSAFSGMDGATVVFDDTFEEPASNATEFEIAFTTNFEYQGGNLLIGIYNTDDGGYRNVTWYGETVNDASGAGSNSSNLNSVSFSQKNFIPKTTFTYTPAGGITCAKPKSLNAVDVTAHTATLTWTAGAEGQSNWDVFVTTDATVVPDENTQPTYQVTECSKTLSGLTGETTYYAYVRSVCGGTDGNSTWAKKVFTTTVACPVPSLTVLVDTRTAYSVDLQWTGNAAADQFEVAYSTTSNFDPNGTEANGVYHRTVEVTPASSHTWTLDGLNPETTYRMRVRANCGGDDGSSSWSDQKSVTTLPTCVAPSSLSATATATSITLNWTAGAQGQDAWDIRYKKSTDSEYTYIHLDNHATTSHTIENFSPATAYNVNVRAYCSETDQSKWGYSAYNQNSDLSVTTECGALTMPYSCDFEGALETSQSSNYSMPKCWTRKEYRGGYEGSYKYYPSVREASYSNPYAHGGNGVSATSGKSMHFYKPNASTDEAAILPEVDAQYTMSNLQISFWARLESYQTNKDLSIGVMTDPSNISTFVEVATVTVKDANFQEYTAFLENYTGEGRHIAIRFNSSTTGYIFVDDITVDVAPTCRIPKDLNAETTELSATLTWTAGLNETAWNVQYKKTSDSNWSEVIPVNSMTYTLTQLKRATVYEARVQAVCSTDDQSDWAEVSFTTDCGIWPIDAANGLFEDFDDESLDLPICWSKIPANNSSVWIININNPMVNGDENNYGAASTGVSVSALDAYLLLPQMHIDGEATLVFDHVFGSYGDYVPSSVVISTTGSAAADFTEILWIQDGNNVPQTPTNVTLSLADYDGQDIYVAFKYEGQGTSDKGWYIDNVQVYVGEIFTKDIAAYTENGGYYLIASPIGGVSPDNVMNLLSNDYDLYYFNQSATDGLEWINYELTGNNFTSLESKKGYLYANSQNVTLKFIGTPYIGDGTVSLDYEADAQFPGWNLIGNPFGTTATLDKPYYRLNTNGSALKTETESTAVAAMEGVFVQATAEGQNATFTPQTRSFEQAAIARTNIVVSSDNGNVLDNAIIRFDNGSTLGKFQLNPNHTKVYIPQGGKDYAIVRSATQGEMPVNFKAEKNGSYTLNVSAENMGMHYLHLIDNMTGADVDLLADPSYSFEAKTTDYASRFRLVFDANENGASTSSAAFAYYNGNNWVISNPSTVSGSEATLQVIDVMGRILRSETLNGNAEINLNQPAGIYMLRLVNGENVKTQKVVVR